MILPKNYPLFKEQVLHKIQVCCESGIWPFELVEFQGWLGNFADDELDEYIALHIVDSLVVRSNKMAKSSYTKFLSCDLYNIVKTRWGGSLEIDAFRALLKSGRSTRIHFICVKNNSEHGDSAERIWRLISGSMVSENLCKDSRILFDRKLQGKVIVFVDDFLGSGDQFSKFCKEKPMKRLCGENTLIYAPLVAAEYGYQRLQDQFPEVLIAPIEMLDQSFNFFNTQNRMFRHDRQNEVSAVRKHFAKMHQKYRPRIEMWYGRDEAGYCLAFEWGCPNQTLPILWLDPVHGRNWQQLFKRRS